MGNKNKAKTKTVIYANDSAKSSSAVVLPSAQGQQSIGFKKSAPASSTTKTTTTVYSGGGGSGNYSGGHKGGSTTTYKGGYYQGVSHSMEPTKAFEYNGIQFWGSAKSKLEKFAFEEGDVIVNCTGTSISIKPFIRSVPSWVEKSEIPGGTPPEILFDWPDFKTPPLSFKLDFWRGLIDSFEAQGINRVFVCCMAGQGRTGTALSAFALATGAVQNHEHAISLIRSEYSKKAVESSDQEMYLEHLVATSGAFFFDDEDEEAEYYKEFYDDFYGVDGEKIDLGKFVGSNIEEIIDWFEDRDAKDED